MKASVYINYLISGEIYKLAIKEVGDMALNSTATVTTLHEENRKKFINYLNLANLAIHKRFQLLQKQYEIDNPTNDEDYILPDDFLAPIYAYYNDSLKEEIPIKDTYRKIVDNVDTAVSLLIPEPFKLTVKGTDTSKRPQIIMIYAASPKVITKVSHNLSISNVYTEALLNYTAYRAYSAISGDIKAENNSYYLRYESNCRQIITSGLGGDNELETNTKLIDSGFI
jgi:hypothetical protein